EPEGASFAGVDRAPMRSLWASTTALTEKVTLQRQPAIWMSMILRCSSAYSSIFGIRSRSAGLRERMAGMRSWAS
ncbi:MAG: hypothetical protein RMJ98_20685, partial [Myxococcales bacterium]|nr:hypothetical protein [Myxococcales bacterium]